MENGRWIYPLLLLAYYLYAAYKKSRKKEEEKSGKQPPTKQVTDKPLTDPFPSYKPQPQQGRSIFQEIFREDPNQPKPTILPKQKKQAPLKPVPKPKKEPTVLVSTTAREDDLPVYDIHSASLDQANEAYSFKTEGDAYVFHPREAFISSIIFNRPEY